MATKTNSSPDLQPGCRIMGRIYIGDESDVYANAKFYRGKLRVITSPVCDDSTPRDEEFFVMYCDHCGSLDVSPLKRKRTNVTEWKKETHLTPFIKRLLGKAEHSRWVYFQLYFSCNKCGADSNYVAGADEDFTHFIYNYREYMAQNWKSRQERAEKYAAQKESNPLGLREENIPVDLVLPAYSKLHDLYLHSSEHEFATF